MHYESYNTWQCFGSGSVGSICFWASRIRLHKLDMRIWILLLSRKNSKKNLDSYCFVTSLWLFIFKQWCKCTVPSKSNNKKTWMSWISLTKIAVFIAGPGRKSHGSETLIHGTPGFMMQLDPEFVTGNRIHKNPSEFGEFGSGFNFKSRTLLIIFFLKVANFKIRNTSPTTFFNPDPLNPRTLFKSHVKL